MVFFQLDNGAETVLHTEQRFFHRAQTGHSLHREGTQSIFSYAGRVPDRSLLLSPDIRREEMRAVRGIARIIPMLLDMPLITSIAR